MKITLCQLNPLVGDIEGNTARISSVLEEHRHEQSDLFIFPELFLQGYPPRDLLEKGWFIECGNRSLKQLQELSRSFPGTGILFGTAVPMQGRAGTGLANAAVLICDGKVLIEQHKSLLPTYDVFDESRYFEPSVSITTVSFKGEVLGISICEDAWSDPILWPGRPYGREPMAELAAAGATLFINVSASPFHVGKESVRFNVMRNHARKHRLPLVFVNQVGGNDDLIFDGNSMFFNHNGDLLQQLPAFREAVMTIETGTAGVALPVPALDNVGSVHDALVLGVRDYVRKCGFKEVLVGLSGGIDSAVTAALAACAVGPEHVWGVTMPSRYSSAGSVDDSALLAKNLSIRFSQIPVEEPNQALLSALDPLFTGTPSGVAEENLQARIRGTLLMALSNKFGHLLLSTGNKSELAVGYSTLYGDMNGGLSVIADLTKGMVYQLAAYINRDQVVIPRTTITKPPSAELRPDQKDEDTLPPYPVLDAIVELLVESDKSAAAIVAEGFDPATVSWVVRAMAHNEYKRRQAPIGLKVSPKAFGFGRRFPIAALYQWR